MAEVVSTLIKWLQTLPPDSKVFVDEDGMTLHCDDGWGMYYELGGEPDGKKEDNEEEK